MICKKCGSLMDIDDVDFRFEGNYDRYYICSNMHCRNAGFDKVRYNKVIYEEQYNEIDGVIYKSNKNNSNLDGSEFN